MLEHLGHDGMQRRERGERLLVGRVLAGLGFLRVLHQRELAEEHLAQLARRADVERRAGVLVDGRLQPRLFRAQLLADFLERDRVEPDAFVLHRGEHGQQRRLDLVEDPLLRRFLQPRLESGVQLQREIGAFHRAAGGQCVGVSPDSSAARKSCWPVAVGADSGV